jgi:16S rRNA U516 pseudouridylate synthase RsuA-like enzyme
MRTSSTLIAAAAFALLGACSRTESGDVVVKRPVSVDVKTIQDTIRIPGVGTRVDTINAPTVGTKKDTIIVNKPVVGSKKKDVKVPEVKRP